jgi:methyl-accepting chemotaxis protein
MHNDAQKVINDTQQIPTDLQNLVAKIQTTVTDVTTDLTNAINVNIEEFNRLLDATRNTVQSIKDLLDLVNSIN